MNHRVIDDIANRAGQAPGVLEQIGTLRGKRVYSVAYPTGLRGILVERQTDRFLPVLFVSPEGPIDRLGVATVQGEEILHYSSRISGTGNFTDEWYFVLDRGVPRNVEYQTVLLAGLKRILPEKFGVWKGGGFNLESLTFSHGVWRDSDGNCCPTGGSVEVVFGFEDGRFLVKSSRYRKPD